VTSLFELGGEKNVGEDRVEEGDVTLQSLQVCRLLLLTAP
jgi:hypothetical protein